MLADDLLGGIAEDSLGPVFQLVRTPSRVFEAMMSSDDSTMAASLSFNSAVFIWEETSRPILEAPTISPSSLRIGETVSETSMMVPSFRLRLVW